MTCRILAWLLVVVALFIFGLVMILPSFAVFGGFVLGIIFTFALGVGNALLENC